MLAVAPQGHAGSLTRADTSYRSGLLPWLTSKSCELISSQSKGQEAPVFVSLFAYRCHNR
jgi:hypothetical protein